MNAIVKVPFDGGDIECARDDGGAVWVVLAPICARLGDLKVDGQVQKLKEIPHMARVQKIWTLRADGREVDQWAVNLDGMAAWLMSISLKRVARDVRPALERLQADGARVLRDHFFPQASAKAPPAEPSPATRLLPEKTAICFEAARLLGEPNMVALFGPDLARTKAEHYIAEATGKEPQDVAPRMLTAEDYLRQRGLSAKEANASASAFGKLVKAAYVRRHDRAPPQVDRFVHGAIRPVCGYTEADRPLFDEAFGLLIGPTKKAAG
ncbi:MAG TPA: phage antirepressor N-terminal domain-containing protein [Polyangiaceae bacterium]|nr:phage antirepressor N-terminal domain-containing protein [Polyangiaceae bacterium]